MKKIVLLFAILCLCFGLCACCLQHEWADPTCTAPKTCVKCGKTEGEALGHEWIDATCTEAKTCSVCGATEGEALGHQAAEAGYLTPEICTVCGEELGPVKPSFFESNKIKVAEKPKNFTVKSCVVDRETNPNQVGFPETKIVFKNYTVTPSAQRKGYKTIYLTYTGTLVPPHFTQWYIVPCGTLCDYYTGHCFSERAAEGNDAIALQDTFSIDGSEYSIYYLMTLEWTKEGEWSDKEKDYIIEYEVSYMVDVPEDYDGLLLDIRDINKWKSVSENMEIKSGAYPLKDKRLSHLFHLDIG